jgi:hypothetical protein
MNTRSASFRDLAQIEQLYRDNAAAEEREGVIPVLSADSPVPQHSVVRLWYAVSKTISSLVPLTDAGDKIYVAENGDGRICGFIQAQSVRGSNRSWQILNLCTAGGKAQFAREPLLTHLTSKGSEHGVKRFHVRLPLDHPLVPIFLEQGFTQYATEQILFHEDSAPRLVEGNPSGVLRPARREDLGGIYLLYLRTTPSHVANLEGPSHKAWQAAFQEGTLSRLGRDDTKHFVAEQAGISAWCAMRPASSARPTLLALMCEGHDGAFREDVITAALAQAPPGPLVCVLRHYDSELIRALQARGFEIFGSQLLLVRDLATKVKLRTTSAAAQPVLAHAGVARSVDVSLRVLTRGRRGRSKPSPR